MNTDPRLAHTSSRQCCLQLYRNGLPRCYALGVASKYKRADPLGNESRRVVTVLALDMQGACPKLFIVDLHSPSFAQERIKVKPSVVSYVVTV